MCVGQTWLDFSKPCRLWRYVWILPSTQLWLMGPGVIGVPLFLKISCLWLGQLPRSFFGLLQWIKVAFGRRQNLRFWWISLMCGIWWKFFKVANSTVFSFIFASEMLPSDSIPVLGNLISNTKHTSRTSWFVGSTLHIPSFSPTCFFRNGTSKISIHEIWCKKCHGKICQKILDQFCIHHFLRKFVLAEPTTQTSGTFFLWCTLILSEQQLTKNENFVKKWS